MQSARTLINVNDMAITARNPLLDDSEANPAVGAGVEDNTIIYNNMVDLQQSFGMQHTCGFRYAKCTLTIPT